MVSIAPKCEKNGRDKTDSSWPVTPSPFLARLQKFVFECLWHKT